MASKDAQLTALRALLPPSEVFDHNSPQYKEQSAPWSTLADQHPTLVLQPTTLPTLSKVIQHLYPSTLDFAVRNTGTGSASARDVIVSTHGLKSFAFDRASETVTLGSGFAWGEVDILMEQHAPGYQVVGARCSWVGVAGSALWGGLSWLSHAFGLIGDPQNCLDMQVVLRDGRVVWASEEPELLWALRGGGGNFGVVTALKLRARRYPDKIFCGVIFYPHSSLRAISKAVAAMAARPGDPKIAMHVLNRGSGLGEAPQGAKPGAAILPFDAHGEAHARSEDGFKWAFEIPGAQVVQVGEMSLQQVNAAAESFGDWKGTNVFWGSAPLIAEVDEGTVERVFAWWEDSINAFEGFQDCSTCLFEFIQEGAFNSSGSRAATAWPHSGRRHVIQGVLGCKAENAPSDVNEMVKRQFEKLGPMVAGDSFTKEFCPSYIHEWNNVDEVYGENVGKLREVKKKYDPQNRFNKAVDLWR